MEEDSTTGTDIGRTQDSFSDEGDDDSDDMSPGTGPDIEFGVSTGGLDFMSSTGYPQIEFGYDDVSDGDEDSDSGNDESTSPDDQGPKDNGRVQPNLVSYHLTAPLAISVLQSECVSVHTCSLIP